MTETLLGQLSGLTAAAWVLAAGGALTVSDADDGEAAFAAQAGTTGSAGLGTFTLDAAGNYSAQFQRDPDRGWQADSLQALATVEFSTGAIEHRVTTGVDYMQAVGHVTNLGGYAVVVGTSSLANPVYFTQPAPPANISAAYDFTKRSQTDLLFAELFAGRLALALDNAGLTRELSAVPLYIDETPALSVAALRSRARRITKRRSTYTSSPLPFRVTARIWPGAWKSPAAW